MPFYAYRCASCGHQEDVLQKISDEPLTQCPQCGQPHFVKQVTAAAFQLKGSGWYVTDFRNGNSGAKPKTAEGAAKPEGKADSSGADTNTVSGNSSADSTATSSSTAASASSDSHGKT